MKGWIRNATPYIIQSDFASVIEKRDIRTVPTELVRLRITLETEFLPTLTNTRPGLKSEKLPNFMYSTVFNLVSHRVSNATANQTLDCRNTEKSRRTIFMWLRPFIDLRNVYTLNACSYSSDFSCYIEFAKWHADPFTHRK